MNPKSRKVRFKLPVEDRYGNLVRESQCGRFRIIKRKMASGRNGYWNAHCYELHQDGERIGPLYDQLWETLDAAEMANDPSWEPEFQ